jgi:hypothetical protein
MKFSKYILSILFAFTLSGGHLRGQKISESIYLGRPHFKIETGSATYLYDQAGGGFSSIRDREGLEWIGFKPGNGMVPGSASADFRGLPNLVFQGKDNGCGHPGFDHCISETILPNQIRTQSKSGLWEWYWTFSQEGAFIEITRTDSARNYWFLYEGTPAGSFEPGQQFWGNNVDGYRTDAPPIGSDDIVRGNWEWAYFGHQDVKRCFFVIQLTPDQSTDYFSYMGSSPEGNNSPDGMVVFGFGRDGATPLMSGPKQFFIGFVEQFEFKEEIPGKLQKLKHQVSVCPINN